nr:unnamed protein product [Callosobruchus chinensis]
MGDEPNVAVEDTKTCGVPETQNQSDSEGSRNEDDEAPRDLDDVGEEPEEKSKEQVNDELFTEQEEKPQVALMMPEVTEDEENREGNEQGGKNQAPRDAEGAGEIGDAEAAAASEEAPQVEIDGVPTDETEIPKEESADAQPLEGTEEAKELEEEEEDTVSEIVTTEEGETTVTKKGKRKKKQEVRSSLDSGIVKKAPSIDYDMAPRYQDGELDIISSSPSGDFNVVDSDVSVKFYSNVAEEAEEEEEYEKVQEEEVPHIDREPYLERYKELQSQIAVSKLKNCILQKKLAFFFKRRKMDHVLKEPEQQFDTQQKYGKKLDQFGELTELDNTQRKTINEELSNLKAKRKAKFEELTEMFKNMQDRELEIGTGLIHTKTGNPIPDKLIEKLLRRQRIQMETVSSMRLKFIQLKEMVNEKQEAIALLDNIGEGLHLMDYEQLKVENRSFADKIEERDEELTRLRFKCQNTIQILAHIREKSSALDCDNEDLKDDLAVAEGHQMQCRERLNDMKQQRDYYRNQTMKLKDESGLLLQPDLLRDMEDSIGELDRAKRFLENLQNQSKTITKQIRNIRKNMEYSEMIGRKSIQSNVDKSSSLSQKKGKRSSHTSGAHPILPEDAFDHLHNFYPNIQHNSNKKIYK